MFPSSSRKVSIICLLLLAFGVFQAVMWTRPKELKVKLFRFQFILVAELIMFAFSKFIWNKLVKDLKPILSASLSSPSSPSSLSSSSPSLLILLLIDLWKSLVLIFLFLSHASYLCGYFLVFDEPHFVSLLSFLCLGAFSLICFFLFTLVVLKKVLTFFIPNLSILSSSRRLVLFQNFSIVFLALIMTSYGGYSASLNPPVKHIDLHLNSLSRHFDQYRIVQISDIHAGPTIGRTRIKAVVDIVNQLNPDLIVITGDLVDGSVKKLAGAVAPIKELRARDGTYFVTGNHEYYTGDVENWFLELKRQGVHVLHNQHQIITRSQSAFCLVGVDDVIAGKMRYDGHGFKLDDAMSGCDPRLPVILLAHQPSMAKEALNKHSNIQLVLSGHTHGGQFFPASIPVYFLNPFYSGLYRYRNGLVYVNSGTFFWGVPMKLWADLEITHFTVHVA